MPEKSKFWGVGPEFDQDWVLTSQQIKLKHDLKETCRRVIRPLAAHCDRNYEYPRTSLNALAELGLLGLIVPKELGGLGENHVAVTMVVETIARYGCPSTALIYGMHIDGVATLLQRYQNNKTIRDLLSRLDKDKLVGTILYSDPATGSHAWFPLSNKCKVLPDGRFKVLKYGSWATSAGFADWYMVQTVSPTFIGDCRDVANFLIFKDVIRTSSDDWSALGMHGNYSGPIIVEGILETDRLIGYPEDGNKVNFEALTYFLLQIAGVYNGISLALLDLAKRHVTRKAHADAGMRVCDYPTIQDYFGHAICSTNASRSHAYLIAQKLDDESNNNDWTLHNDLDFQPRSKFVNWAFQLKYTACSNATEVADKMLHACGGTGYKTDLGIERLLRDAKSGWVLGNSNEHVRQVVGKLTLMGSESIDFWEDQCNERIVNHELGKMSMAAKKTLVKKLMEDVQNEESRINKADPYQDTDFENPFNTKEPYYSAQDMVSKEGKIYKAALNPTRWTPLKLSTKSDMANKIALFTFSYLNSDAYSGCLPGQYIQVRIEMNGKFHFRYFSPVSTPDDFGKIELMLKFESHGIISNFFKELKTGESIDFLGPCGGFEYEPNLLSEISILAAGSGITPGLQIIRSVVKNPTDKTKINLVYYSETISDILWYEELNAYKVKCIYRKRCHQSFLLTK